MPESSGSHVFDTVSISNFAFADALWLLRERYRGRASLTSQVMNELEAGVAAGREQLLGALRLVGEGHFDAVVLTPVERRNYRRLLQTLSTGGTSCLAVAASRRMTVVTDDSHARRRAREDGTRVTGTIGILKAACLGRQLPLDEAENIIVAWGLPAQ